MRVFSLRRLREFWLIHPDAEKPLRDWYKEACRAAWKSINDVRLSYSHADGVRMSDGDVATVFNIGGNKYRLITRIRYARATVFIDTVLTHSEYNRNRWKG
jgi:mRNA interferase HigB